MVLFPQIRNCIIHVPENEIEGDILGWTPSKKYPPKEQLKTSCLYVCSVRQHVHPWKQLSCVYHEVNSVTLQINFTHQMVTFVFIANQNIPFFFIINFILYNNNNLYWLLNVYIYCYKWSSFLYLFCCRIQNLLQMYSLLISY